MKVKVESGNRLVVGGPPRADLLPPEVGERARARRARGTAITMIVLSVVIALVGSGAATYFAIDADLRLAAASERTAEILAEQGQYSEVRQVTTLIDAAKEARIVATSTEVGWKQYLADIQASLPAGTTVTNVVAEMATPLSDYPQPVVPLQGSRIGVINFTALSASLPDIEKWLAGLSELDGFVDASPRSVTLDDQDEAKPVYIVNITMHVDEGALLGRYLDGMQGWGEIDAPPAKIEETDDTDGDADEASADQSATEGEGE